MQNDVCGMVLVRHLEGEGVQNTQGIRRNAALL